MHLTQQENKVIAVAIWGFILLAYVWPAVLRFMRDEENPIAEKIKLDFLEIVLYFFSFARFSLGVIRKLLRA